MKKAIEAIEDKRRKATKHNGWANWDTWEFQNRLSNDERNYNFIRQNGKQLLGMSDSALLRKLRPLVNNREVDTSFVSANEIRRIVREFYKDYVAEQKQAPKAPTAKVKMPRHVKKTISGR